MPIVRWRPLQIKRLSLCATRRMRTIKCREPISPASISLDKLTPDTAPATSDFGLGRLGRRPPAKPRPGGLLEACGCSRWSRLSPSSLVTRRVSHLYKLLGGRTAKCSLAVVGFLSARRVTRHAGRVPQIISLSDGLIVLAIVSVARCVL
jgi:hypothetical protein